MNEIVAAAADLAAFVGRSMIRLVPFLLVSVPLTVALKRSGAGERIKRTLDRGPVLAVFLATLFGAASPLCSCSVVPAIAALLGSGVPLAPVMAFWLASPSMDPEILALSAASVGWELAVWRLAATFAMSFGAGLAVLALDRRGYFADGILRLGSVSRGGACACSATAAVPSAAAPTSCGCSGVRPAEKPRTGAAALIAEMGGTAGTLALYMLVAYSLEAVIMRFLPASSVAPLLGSSTPWSVPLAALLGVPLYTTNLTSLGIVSGLLGKGMDPAAALSFLIGGAVTTVPAMSAVFGIVRPKVFAVYLGFAVAGALAAGYAWKLAHLFA